MNQLSITSRDNSLLRRARAVRDGKEDDAIFVEGVRLCEEALASGLQIEAVISAAELSKERAARLVKELNKIAGKSALVNEKLLASISSTKTPQGIIVLARRPVHDAVTFAAAQPRAPFLVVLHRVNNPLNVGAIMRTAEAAGASGVVATANTADPYSTKSLRGAMGAAFRLPIWTGSRFDEVIAWCRKKRIRTACADAKGDKLYSETDWRKSVALIVGPESEGLSADEISEADAVVRIPMQGKTESLNVAVATGIILYEAARQRMQK